MGAQVAKQYLPLCGRRVLDWALAPFAAEPRIAGALLVLAAQEPLPSVVGWCHEKPLLRAEGGAERCDSVRRGLQALTAAAPQDWVLVHDAARPCLSGADLARLIDALGQDPVGGLLALPVQDTVKRAGADGRVECTVERRDLWRALTPQMFRLQHLRAALEDAHRAGVYVTDESAAMERHGHRPRLVAGSADNIKITSPGDLALAEQILARRPM
jgi:2-C-methyl-D-erythritol 4-phosphate cytidylyltransferase